MSFDHERRAICYNGPHRPCLCPRCPHHLWDVVTDDMRKRGLWNMPDTCLLDVCGRGEQTQEEVAAIMGATRQLVSFIEVRALSKLHGRMPRHEFEKARMV